MNLQAVRADTLQTKSSTSLSEGDAVGSLQSARLWPVAMLFIAFTSAMSACHWPYPDPREPVIQPTAEVAQHGAATANSTPPSE